MTTIVQNSNGFTHFSDGKYSGQDCPMSMRSSSRPTQTVFDTSALFARVDIPHWTGKSTTHINIGDMNVD